MRVNIPREYLIGEKISNVYNFRYDDRVYFNRFQVIRMLLKKKPCRVIDLGAVDYVPNIQKKINNNEWLHKELMNECEQVLAVDLNERGIHICKKGISKYYLRGYSESF